MFRLKEIMKNRIVKTDDSTRVLATICLSEPFDVIDRLCCFFGGSSKAPRLVNRDDAVAV